MTPLTINELLASLHCLRRDGIFVKRIEHMTEGSDIIDITLGNYITDSDGGHDIDCLYEKDDNDVSCSGKCGYCEEITCGMQDIKAFVKKSCVPCPFCGVPTRPHSLKERLYSIRLSATREDGVNLIDGGITSKEMVRTLLHKIQKTVDTMNNFPTRPEPLDLSGGPPPSYGFSFHMSHY